MRKIVWLVVVGGCAEEVPPSEYETAQLSAPTVRVQDDDTTITSVVRRDWAGSLNADDSGGGNFELKIVSGLTTIQIDVFTPSGVDLTEFSGQPIIATVAPEPISDELSVAISAEDGELLYLLEPVRPDLLTEERFGPNMLAPATDLGHAIVVGGWDLAISSYYMRTDTGDAELYPGEPQEVMLSGDTYRATLLAGFDATRTVSVQEECVGPQDRTAFELVRVAPGTADLDPILRDTNLPPPVAECFALN